MKIKLLACLACLACGEIEAKKNVTVITLTEEVLKLLGGNIVRKALDIPLNLPMIVEPKYYKDVKNLSDGGYLLNNEEITQLLFTNENILQTGTTTIIDNKVIDSINGLAYESSFQNQHRTFRPYLN